jgi:hypothetical protein
MRFATSHLLVAFAASFKTLFSFSHNYHPPLIYMPKLQLDRHAAPAAAGRQTITDIATGVPRMRRKQKAKGKKNKAKMGNSLFSPFAFCLLLSSIKLRIRVV